MKSLFLPLVALFVCAASGFVLRTGCCERRSAFPLANFKNDGEREEQFRLQQEMLAKRRNPRALEKEKEATEKRRLEASKKIDKTLWAKNSDPSADPILEWREALKKGEIKDIGYVPGPPKSASLFGLSIPLPMSPIDIPEMDNGQRFDLRLPYAERGYEDSEADVMGKIGAWFSGLGGGGKKKEGREKK